MDGSFFSKYHNESSFLTLLNIFKGVTYKVKSHVHYFYPKIEFFSSHPTPNSVYQTSNRAPLALLLDATTYVIPISAILYINVSITASAYTKPTDQRSFYIVKLQDDSRKTSER